MKFSLSNIIILSLCVSAVLAVRNDCLDSERSNLASVCRNECAQEGAVAFSISNEDIRCRCYPNVDGLGSYTGNGDRNSGKTCYSMADAETKLLDHGECIVDSSTGGYGTKYTMQWCEDGEEEKIEDCLVKGRYNFEEVCKKECVKHDSSVAFAVSDDDVDISCHCYPRIEGIEYTASVELDPYSNLICYAMERQTTEVLLGYGGCIPSDIYLSRSRTEHTLKICLQSENLLRGSVSA